MEVSEVTAAAGEMTEAEAAGNRAKRSRQHLQERWRRQKQVTMEVNEVKAGATEN